jgi:hypothetical protein
MRDRSTEQSNDSITDELLDRPAVTLNLSAHMPPIWFLDRPNILGVTAFRGCRETDQVGEQDADDFPLCTGLRCRNKRRTAGVAEPRLRAVFLPALRTPRHRSSLGSSRETTKRPAAIATRFP